MNLSKNNNIIIDKSIFANNEENRHIKTNKVFNSTFNISKNRYSIKDKNSILNIPPSPFTNTKSITKKYNLKLKFNSTLYENSKNDKNVKTSKDIMNLTYNNTMNQSNRDDIMDKNNILNKNITTTMNDSNLNDIVNNIKKNSIINDKRSLKTVKSLKIFSPIKSRKSKILFNIKSVRLPYNNSTNRKNSKDNNNINSNSNNSKDSNDGQYNRIKVYSPEEILEIRRKRNFYRPNKIIIERNRKKKKEERSIYGGLTKSTDLNHRNKCLETFYKNREEIKKQYLLMRIIEKKEDERVYNYLKEQYYKRIEINNNFFKNFDENLREIEDIFEEDKKLNNFMVNLNNFKEKLMPLKIFKNNNSKYSNINDYINESDLGYSKIILSEESKILYSILSKIKARKKNKDIYSL